MQKVGEKLIPNHSGNEEKQCHTFCYWRFFSSTYCTVMSKLAVTTWTNVYRSVVAVVVRLLNVLPSICWWPSYCTDVSRLLSRRRQSLYSVAGPCPWAHGIWGGTRQIRSSPCMARPPPTLCCGLCCPTWQLNFLFARGTWQPRYFSYLCWTFSGLPRGPAACPYCRGH